ncbi:hypothetical protein ALC62_12117 [Cyphomyrmex costatus]|uniref:Uncharacterized protein n=1 Tax=Cyphomyrmex costatus TaxID=456900 RepID=A0A151IBR9_9HYME|nr:hypothetical protein ALC62_12117 [Cyphomyrmex costatus]
MDGRTNKQLKRKRDGRTVEIVYTTNTINPTTHGVLIPRPPSCAAFAEALPLFFKRKPCDDDDTPRCTAGGPLFSKLNSSQTTATAARALRPRGDDNDNDDDDDDEDDGGMLGDAGNATGMRKVSKKYEKLRMYKIYRYEQPRTTYQNIENHWTENGGSVSICKAIWEKFDFLRIM